MDKKTIVQMSDSSREMNRVRCSQDFLPCVIRSSFSSAVVNCLQARLLSHQIFLGTQMKKVAKSLTLSP